MTTSSPTQVLTFVLGEETYGVDILRVQEIRGWTAVTKFPHAPPHVLGVLNLRGSIIPVVDLRMRFDLATANYDAVTVIVVLSVICKGTRRNFGVVVDGVSDVMDVDAAQVKPAPGPGRARGHGSRARPAAHGATHGGSAGHRQVDRYRCDDRADGLDRRDTGSLGCLNNSKRMRP